MMLLKDRRDYEENDKDQLEKNYADLPLHLKKLLHTQFKRRVSMSSKKIAVSPPNWGGTVEKMKEHKEITNPFALAWWMSKQKKGDKWGPGGELSHAPKPHYKEKKSTDDDDERVAQIVDKVVGIVPVSPVTESSKKYSTNDTIKSADGSYITVKTNYDEENGNVLLEEYTIEKNGKIDTYNNADDFAARLAAEGLLQKLSSNDLY